MTYKETTQRIGAELIERIALVLSKRPDRSELAAAVFAELIKTSRASHAVLWRRNPEADSSFHAEQASCNIEKNEYFDPSLFAFWKSWQAGQACAHLLESLDSESLCRGGGGEISSSRDSETTAGAFLRSPWAKYNLLLPLASENDSVSGILSLHQASDPLSDCSAIFSPSLSKIIANSLLEDKRDDERSAAQVVSELWLERSLRLIQTRVHSRVDRDFVLQAAVDTLGNILKVSSCLVLRNNSGTSTRVTHEFVDPELSPLGLGGSFFIPQVIAAQMCEKTTVFEETGIRKHEGQFAGGLQSLFEGSIRSLAGTAIIVNAECFGALVVQSNKERKWQRHELKLLEGTAVAVSMALRNAELYQEAREQVFNLNLLTNLSRQLSSAVEQLFKHPGKSETPEDSTAELQQIHVPLSGRELEVLRLIASGMSNREIAQHLFLTESTVELHASRIRKKLKLKSRTALVKFACDNHLV